MARNQDLTIKRGTTFPIEITITDADGDPVDLTGATIYFTAKAVESDIITDDASAVIEKDVTVHTDPTEGESLVTLSAADTTVTPNTYFYDITVKYASGVVNTPIEGKLKIDGKPTNRSV